MTPSILSNNNETVIFTVKTKVPPEKIQNIYFLHPTQPQMPSLKYNAEKEVWECNTSTGRRFLNIFCNTKIYARIHSKDYGIGPAFEIDIKTQYK